MPPVGFEPTISAGERPQTDALDRAATGTGHIYNKGQKTVPVVIGALGTINTLRTGDADLRV